MLNIEYYLPDWDDKVYKEYDFTNDRALNSHKVYLWEIYEDHPVDGILVSMFKIKFRDSEEKRKQIYEVGLREYLRLGKLKLMGDCGAWGYMNQKEPPFKTRSLFQDYEKLGFDIVASIDMPIVANLAKTHNEIQRRMQITYKNAIEGFELWKKHYREIFDYVAVVQGYTINDYLKMFKKYYKHGMRSIGFGGLAKSPTSFIKKLISKLFQLIKQDFNQIERLHFFGLGRENLIDSYLRFKELDTELTISFDSASPLRNAWMSTSNYYIVENGKLTKYAAIRLSKDSIKKFKKLYNSGKDAEEIILNLYSKKPKTIDRDNMLKKQIITLEKKPWKSCSCKICKTLDIDVIIFSGNERNRRRGFHNVWTFYNFLKKKAKENII